MNGPFGCSNGYFVGYGAKNCPFIMLIIALKKISADLCPVTKSAPIGVHRTARLGFFLKFDLGGRSRGFPDSVGREALCGAPESWREQHEDGKHFQATEGHQNDHHALTRRREPCIIFNGADFRQPRSDVA